MSMTDPLIEARASADGRSAHDDGSDDDTTPLNEYCSANVDGAAASGGGAAAQDLKELRGGDAAAASPASAGSADSDSASPAGADDAGSNAGASATGGGGGGHGDIHVSASGDDVAAEGTAAAATDAVPAAQQQQYLEEAPGGGGDDDAASSGSASPDSFAKRMLQMSRENKPASPREGGDDDDDDDDDTAAPVAISVGAAAVAVPAAAAALDFSGHDDPASVASASACGGHSPTSADGRGGSSLPRVRSYGSVGAGAAAPAAATAAASAGGGSPLAPVSGYGTIGAVNSAAAAAAGGEDVWADIMRSVASWSLVVVLGFEFISMVKGCALPASIIKDGTCRNMLITSLSFDAFLFITLILTVYANRRRPIYVSFFLIWTFGFTAFLLSANMMQLLGHSFNNNRSAGVEHLMHNFLLNINVQLASLLPRRKGFRYVYILEWGCCFGAILAANIKEDVVESSLSIDNAASALRTMAVFELWHLIACFPDDDNMAALGEKLPAFYHPISFTVEAKNTVDNYLAQRAAAPSGAAAAAAIAAGGGGGGGGGVDDVDPYKVFILAFWFFVNSGCMIARTANSTAELRAGDNKFRLFIDDHAAENATAALAQFGRSILPLCDNSSSSSSTDRIIPANHSSCLVRQSAPQQFDWQMGESMQTIFIVFTFMNFALFLIVGSLLFWFKRNDLCCSKQEALGEKPGPQIDPGKRAWMLDVGDTLGEWLERHGFTVLAVIGLLAMDFHLQTMDSVHGPRWAQVIADIGFFGVIVCFSVLRASRSFFFLATVFIFLFLVQIFVRVQFTIVMAGSTGPNIFYLHEAVEAIVLVEALHDVLQKTRGAH